MSGKFHRLNYLVSEHNERQSEAMCFRLRAKKKRSIFLCVILERE